MLRIIYGFGIGKTIMEIIYTLAEDDLITLAEFQIEKLERLQKQSRSRRILYPLGFSLLALGTLLKADNLILPIIFGLFALISFFLAPMFLTWLAHRRLPQIVKSKMTSTSIGERKISANEIGLQYKSGELYSEVPWSIVNDISDTPSHVFIAIDNIFSLVIPKSEVDENELNNFIALIRNKIQRDDA